MKSERREQTRRLQRGSFLAQISDSGALVFKIPAHNTLIDTYIEDETIKTRDKAEKVVGEVDEAMRLIAQKLEGGASG